MWVEYASVVEDGSLNGLVCHESISECPDNVVMIFRQCLQVGVILNTAVTKVLVWLAKTCMVILARAFMWRMVMEEMVFLLQ